MRRADSHGMRRCRIAPSRLAVFPIIALMLAALCGCASKHHTTSRRNVDLHSLWPVIVETPLVTVFSDGSREDAEVHAGWMERTIEEFERFTQSAGWRTAPLVEPLTAMLFSTQRDLQSFATRHDHVNIGATSGYYSPHNDWVAMSVGESSINSDSIGVRANPQAGLALRSDEPQEESQHGSPAARCVHETIHQLMFRSELMDKRVKYPLWIAEGLATAFETDDPLSAESFGPDTGHGPRIAGFNRMVAEDRVIPLRQLISVTSLPRDGIDTHDFYNQSYALATWLCRERPDQVLTYLNRLGTHSERRRLPDQFIRHFEEAFGPIEDVELTLRCNSTPSLIPASASDT